MEGLRTKSIILFVAPVIAILFLLGFSLDSSAATQPAKTPKYGGTLRIADVSDGASIGYPAKLLTAGAVRHVSPGVETLFRFDKDGKVVPWLALSKKDDAKGKTITITLRKGVKFHDGTDFDAEAVKWNFEQSIAAKQMGTEKFKSVEVIDPNTVRINLTEWDSTIISQLCAQGLGMMVSPAGCKKNGVEWCAKNPIGTGPFQFVSWEKDTKTVWKKFPGYWQKGKPYLDEIVWTPIFDAGTRVMSIKAGEVDISATIAAKDVSDLEKSGLVISRGKVGSGSVGLIGDSANPKSPWADLRVRQAAQYAIDTAAIVKSVFRGEGEPANQFIYKGHWGYNPAVVGYPYNPEKAKELLKQAGYPNGFKTKIIYRSNPQEDELFTAVQGFLKAVGIDAELEPAQKGRYDQIATLGGKWEGLIMNRVSPNPDVSGVISAIYAGDGQDYAFMLAPADYKKAINNAIAAPDFAGKAKWTKEIMKLMIDKYALQITLLCRYDFVASQKHVYGHGLNGTPANAMWTPADTWLDK